MISYNLFAIESHGNIRLLSKYGKKMDKNPKDEAIYDPSFSANTA